MTDEWGRHPHHNAFVETIHRILLARPEPTHPEGPTMTDDQQRALEQMHRHLDEHPDDWDTRLVLADLLSETGDNWAEACQRWMARHRRHPWQTRLDVWIWMGPGCEDADQCRAAVLPLGLFYRVADAAQAVSPHGWTRQRAEKRLAWALRQTGAMDEVR